MGVLWEMVGFITWCLYLQLLPHWEKTFGIDLSTPQIGVIDADDVSAVVHTRPAGDVDSPSSFDGEKITTTWSY